MISVLFVNLGKQGSCWRAGVHGGALISNNVVSFCFLLCIPQSIRIFVQCHRFDILAKYKFRLLYRS